MVGGGGQNSAPTVADGLNTISALLTPYICPTTAVSESLFGSEAQTPHKPVQRMVTTVANVDRNSTWAWNGENTDQVKGGGRTVAGVKDDVTGVPLLTTTKIASRADDDDNNETNYSPCSTSTR